MKKSTAEKRQKKFGLITVKEASDAFDRPRVRVNQRTDAEIDALFDECVDGQQDRFIGKTYEGGVAATLIWLVMNLDAGKLPISRPHLLWPKVGYGICPWLARYWLQIIIGDMIGTC